MIYIILLFTLLGYAKSQFRNIVTLPQGRVSGQNNFIEGYQSFLGIPYATVTERYQDAGEPPKWNDVFQAFEDVKCKQYSELTQTITGTEDCLAASVYTPSEESSELLPVIVFVHGGGYYWGSNTNFLYNPKYLVKKKTVVVTINYRLGAFGFLCLKNQGAQGNVGLKDVIAALTWIKNNIAYFGGNPDSVTLWGESAGATTTVALILSQTAVGLFHRAIIDSCSIQSPQLFDRNPIKTASEVANRLGYNTTDVDELLAIFKNSSADDIVKASQKEISNDALAPYIMLPCKEDSSVSKYPVITDDPHILLESAKSLSNLSIIMGYNDKEGIYFADNYDFQGLKGLEKNFTKAIPKSVIFESDESKQQFIKAVRDFYFNGSSINYSGLINYYSDFLIIFPSVKTMSVFAANPDINLFTYYFKYDSLRNYNKLRSRLRFIPGAAHADELFYIFNFIVNQFVPSIPSDSDFIDDMTTLWSSFARTGIPSTKTITWSPSQNQLQFLQLDTIIKMIGLPNQERISFWTRAENMFGLQLP